MKYLLRALLLVPFGLLAGCCANNACGCNDLLADSLFFRLDATKFRAIDLDTVYLARYSTTDSVTLIDAVQLTHRQLVTNLNQLINSQQLNPLTSFSTASPPTSTDSSLIIISNNTPFSPATTGGKLNKYNYVLSIPKGDSLYRPGTSLPRVVYTYRIRSIVLAGQYTADGCCTCYQNSKKTAVVSNTFFNATQSDPKTPIPYQLTRK